MGMLSSSIPSTLLMADNARKWSTRKHSWVVPRGLIAGRAVEEGGAGAVARRGLAAAAVAAAAHAHDLGVDGRAHAVVHLAVDLGQRIACTRE